MRLGGLHTTRPATGAVRAIVLQYSEKTREIQTKKQIIAKNAPITPRRAVDTRDAANMNRRAAVAPVGAPKDRARCRKTDL